METKLMDPRTRLRRDSARTRDRLLDAVGDLLAERGVGFSLPELARASGVATATVYRHFDDVRDAHREFYYRLMDQLVAALAAIPAGHRGERRVELIGERWAGMAVHWGRAATRIRDSGGFLERVRAGDPPTSALYAALAPVVQELIADGAVPVQDLDYAVLLWITVYDERVIVDLAGTLGWTSRRAARMLTASLLAALRAVPPSS